MGATENTSGDKSSNDGAQLARRATMEELLDASSGVEERKLVRKLDLYLIPLIMGVYLFSFVDRSVPPIPSSPTRKTI